ncbi:phage FluMu protein Com [Caldalkalibacillus uzonensis]|uniref:Phage FluMu protein Com n=1 Tax=Caldalkalibacillus uzonensis TaxID=353224 RepID=A0ABU0CRT4_9BACI|nr:GapA-binding peptide SR1P [Caldalkalibacillus uzonensis]MDQ0339130.1 phage FluMu protein Com [Caldalkalibacillus uzonensis]
MGEIVCQTCDKTIAHFEDEKVSVLYGVCPHCHECDELNKEES